MTVVRGHGHDEAHRTVLLGLWASARASWGGVAERPLSSVLERVVVVQAAVGHLLAVREGGGRLLDSRRR